MTTIKTIIGEALGEASALFMSQECKGTEIIMPTEELSRILNETVKMIVNVDDEDLDPLQDDNKFTNEMPN